MILTFLNHIRREQPWDKYIDDIIIREDYNQINQPFTLFRVCFEMEDYECI